MEHILTTGFDFVTTPRNIFTHAISIALLIGLYRDGIERKKLFFTALAEEIVIVLLWLAIPNSLATIFALWVCVSVYERILGPQAALKQNFSLFSVDDGVTEIIRSSSPNLKFTTKTNADGSQLIETSLPYLVYRHRQWGATSLRSDDVVVDISTIRLVEEGCDRSLSRLVRKHGADPARCFCVHLKNGGGTLTVICSMKEDVDAWVAGLLYLFGKRQGDLRAAWLAKLWNDARAKAVYGDVTLDNAMAALEQTNRKVDRAYIKYSFGKLFSNKAHTSLPLSQGQFGRLFDEATKMSDLDNIFRQITRQHGEELTLSPNQFLEFLQKEQKEQVSLDKCKKWIKASETVFPSLNLSSLGFTNYLFMDAHSVFNRVHRTVYQDMRRPLSHYFIATSHNTYLTKDQLRGKSSVEAYISAFKRGCKCVELDTWDGPNNEPIIYHGHTLTSKILFKDVVQAIHDYAFVVSDFPVILSFENHCSVEQQKVMADHLKRILGSKMYTKQPPEDEKHLPSPEALKGFIIVKNKKMKHGEDDAADDFEDEDDVTEEEIAKIEKEKDKDEEEETASINGDESHEAPERRSSHTLKSSFFSFRKNLTGKSKRSSTAGSGDSKDTETSKLCQDLSDLVAYCQPVRFRGFTHARENRKHYEMSSFGENKSMKMAKEEPLAWLHYNRRMMCRIYPAGGRFDSSNYNPMPLWAVGCQLVALNYQTGTRAMQLNQGLFRDNGGCGYVLKPEFMLSDGHNYDPRGPFDDAKAKMVIVKIICGHQLPATQDNNKLRERQVLAEVAIEGVEQDNQVARTKSIKNSGLNPSWNEVLAFKVRVPELALITFAVKEFPKTFLGQFTLPLRSVTEGYRRIPLENKMSESISQSSIFVHIQIKDFLGHKINDAA